MKKLCAVLAVAFLAGCLGPRRPPPTTPEEVVVVPPPEVLPSDAPAVLALWRVRLGQPPLAVAEFLAAHPHMKLGLILPERFFEEDESSARARDIFTELVARRQVDLVLSLPNRPVLALIHDTELARLSTTTAAALPPRFQWPEDAAGQAALAKSAHRRKWKASPPVLEVPWGVAAGPELKALSRLGFRWFYMGRSGASTPAPGFYDADGAVLAVGAAFPAKAGSSALKTWLTGLAAPAGDSSRFPAAVHVETLEEAAALEAAAANQSFRWVAPSETDADSAFPSAPWIPSDFSPWIGESEENRAWQLLGVARQAVEDFKNSGKAQVHTLDRAIREVYAAESGAVFRALGADGASGRAAEEKREFLASLEQIFRFMGTPPPPVLRHGFAGGGDGTGEETSAPLFRRAGSALIWRDGTKDDRGPGDFFYPTGAGFPMGAWDLRSFRVEPRGEDIVFRWELAVMANPARAPYGFSMALIDTYIDINRLPGAGADGLLSGRPGLVEPQDAWEYALSVDGWGARLYQPSPTGTPRRVASLPLRPVPPSSVEAVVPRKYLRGNPSDWGFAVAVMGRSPSSPPGPEPAPMAVMEQPGPDHFGGALPGRTAPPYIDLLTEGPVQNETLGAYKQGRDAVIPFVRPE